MKNDTVWNDLICKAADGDKSALNAPSRFHLQGTDCMSDTPRTDEAELSTLDIQNGHGPSPYVPAELARQLERELAAANKRAHYEATWHNHYARLQQAAKPDSAVGQAGGSS